MVVRERQSVARHEQSISWPASRPTPTMGMYEHLDDGQAPYHHVFWPPITPDSVESIPIANTHLLRLVLALADIDALDIHEAGQTSFLRVCEWFHVRTAPLS